MALPKPKLKTESIPQPVNNQHSLMLSAQSTDELISQSIREFILIAGKDGVGKTCAIVSLARYVEMTSPDATFFVIDSENKFAGALKAFGGDVPHNISYYKTEDMNQATEALARILSLHKPGDWLAVESMARMWERAQDLGYQAIEGVNKAEYLERRRQETGSKKLPVVPHPDQLWMVVKGAHNGAFLDLISQCNTLNVIASTTVGKPPREAPNRKENAERKRWRFETGMDMELHGVPNLPYMFETFCFFELEDGNVKCSVIRDNLSVSDEPRLEFPVENRKAWAMNFFANCRG